LYGLKNIYRLASELRVSVYGSVPVHGHIHAYVHAHAGELVLLDLLLLVVVAAKRGPARLVLVRRTAIIDQRLRIVLYKHAF